MCLVEVNYSPDLFSLVHVLQNVYTLIPFLVNSALMWRMRRGLSVPVSVFLLLSLMDLFLIFTSISFSGGAVSPYYLLLLPTMAIFAIVFTSLRLGDPLGAAPVLGLHFSVVLHSVRCRIFRRFGALFGHPAGDHALHCRSGLPGLQF
ncbi:MAG: hypothetical protein TQ37_07540 [Candidatus Synechococcus spongiarum 15L]|uniref:Uncharacterized protein n=1 Tax=Candidatus Synechococcus spongiarum 15L TaxID=1608419 RepID=A0A0G8AU64_9SYNE|nr:MAG: hypothetical protein TQ37_07540 [Candidatus Synechococcus spongiarum 15L]